MTIIKSILLLTLISNVCLAEDGVVYLDKGNPAPNEGYLFTVDKAKDTRIKLLERDTYESLNQSLTKTNTMYQQNQDLKDQQIKLLFDRNDQLANSLRDSQSTNTWEKIALFVGGIILTGLAVKGASELHP